MKKILIAMFLAISLSGCASFTEKFETRITCTLAKDEARADSKWGLFGLSSKIADADAVVACK